MSHCCVEGCNTRVISGENSTAKLHRLPRDKKLAVIWKEKLNIKDQPGELRICSKHFSANAYVTTNLGWKVLTLDAVPSENLPFISDNRIIKDEPEAFETPLLNSVRCPIKNEVDSCEQQLSSTQAVTEQDPNTCKVPSIEEPVAYESAPTSGKCCVEGCNMWIESGVAKLHRFPRDKKLALAWKEKLNIKNQCDDLRVCSKHFSGNAYITTNLGWKVLTLDAVPSENLPVVLENITIKDEPGLVKTFTVNCAARLIKNEVESCEQHLPSTHTVTEEDPKCSDVPSIEEPVAYDSAPTSDKCCVEGCNTWIKSGVGSTARLHRFPRVKKLALAWKEKLNIKDLPDDPGVCSKHFSRHDYVRTRLGWSVLTANAVPSKHIPVLLDNFVWDSSVAENEQGAVECLRIKSAVDPINNDVEIIEQEQTSTVEQVDEQSPGSDEVPVLHEHFGEEPLQNTAVCDGFSETRVKNFECPSSKLDCSRENIFSDIGVPGSHTFENTGVQFSLNCTECGKQLSLQNLMSHMMCHGYRETLHWPCHVCEMRFQQKDKLISHLQTHSPDAPHTCVYCGNMFAFREDLNSHLLVHCNKNKTSFPCDVCHVEFANSTYLKIHSLKHDESSWICPHCGIDCITLQNLKKHMRHYSHLYKCPYCERTFISHKTYKNHIIKHRVTGEHQRPRNVDSLSISDTHYYCKICSTGCRSHEGLETHYERVHAIEGIGDGLKNCKTYKRKRPNVYRTLKPYKPFGTEINDESYQSSSSSGIGPETAECSDESSCLVVFDKKVKSDNDVVDSSRTLTQGSHDEFKCIECGESCGSVSGLTIHYEKHVKGETESVTENWSSDEGM